MNFIKTKTEDHILHVLIDRGRSNAIDTSVVIELLETIDAADKDLSIEGVILSGKEGFFSSGLDLIALYEYSEDEMKEFWTLFMRLLQRLTSFSKPLVSAITGHSPAGGCVLAICCDYRIMAEGEYIIGLNEVPVGLVVPKGVFDLYSFWIGEALAYRSLLEGKLFNPQQALSVGLVDEIVPFDRIQNAALRKVKAVTQFERNAWSTTKMNFRKNLVDGLQRDQEIVINQVLQQWWKPSTRSVMKTIIENLTKKKS